MKTEPPPSEVVFFKLGDEDVVHGRWKEPHPLEWSFWYHGRPMELRIEGMPGVGRFGNYVDISIRDQGTPYMAEQTGPHLWALSYHEAGWHTGSYSQGDYELEIDLSAMVVTWRCLDVSHTFYSDPSDR